MPRIVVLDPLAPEGLELLQNAPGFECEVRTGLKGDIPQLKAVLAEADGAICRSGVQITAEVLEGNRRLRAIARAGVGVDNIDFNAAKRLGVVVMNTPAGNTISTAEHTIALMLGLARSIAPAYQSLIEGRWDRKKYLGAQLAGKTLGIVGLGRVGQAVAARAITLEMKVLGADLFLPAERIQSLGIEPVPEIRQMLPRVDFLTVHTPLTDQTRGLIGMAELEVLKPGVRLINTARGEIYDEAALVAGLESGKIGGVALDVYPEEPRTEHPLFGKPNVLCTPHLGASTEEAQTSVAVEAAELLINFFTSGAVRHAVNMPPIDPQELETLRPYLNLVYRLGLLQAQLCDCSPQSVELLYKGKVAETGTNLLCSAFAAGILERALDVPANIVNAEEMLRERGVHVQTSRQPEMGDFSSLISTTVATDRGSRFTAAGTVFGNQMLRLVRLDDYRLEAYLDGTLLIFHHNDTPGVIGASGTILGQHGVNIAQMAVGRSQPGGPAVGVLNLDAVPPSEALEELKADQRIHGCQVVQLPPAGELPAWLGG